MMKGSYFLLYRFSRDGGLPSTSDRETTLRLCQEVYTVPAFIPIRDKYVKISKQTSEGILSFLFVDGSYTFKVIKKGKPVEERNMECEEFFKLIKERVGVQFEVSELTKK